MTQTITGAPSIIIPKKKIILDATVLSTLMGCGRLTDFRFNHNLIAIGGKSNSLETGSMMHKYLEVYYGTIIQGFNKDQAHTAGMIAAELYARGCPHCTGFISTVDNPIPSCKHKINEFVGLHNTPPDPEKPYQVGWKYVLSTCEQYREFYRSDSWIPLEVEKVKTTEKPMYEDDEIEIMWKSKFDLICDTNVSILPVDHKTMKQRRDTVSLNNQFIGQCLTQGTRTMIVNKIGFQKTLQPHEKFERVSVSYSLKRLQEWKDTILPYWAYKLIEYKENEYWAPNFDHCDNKYGACPFMEVCECDPDDRERELRQSFIVGEDWNPSNEVTD